MSRILKRPMFSMGGSTSAGITSGLSRQGYAKAGSVDFGEVDVISEQMKKRYGPVPRQGYNVYDFLTEWGLNMASSPPMGNVIQTAAGTAREPHAKMVEGKGKDEMAQYMANMSSTDKALAAFTDIKVAQTEADANRELKNLPLRREIIDGAYKIQQQTQAGTYGSNFAEALGISEGNSLIAKMVEEKGGSVNAGQIKRTYKEDGQGVAPIDFKPYEMDKIWWDPDKKQWLTVQMQEKDGVEFPTGIYHGSKEEAFAALGSTIKTGDGTGDGKGDGTGDKVIEEVTEEDKWRYLPEDTSKKFKKWLDETKSKEGSFGEADITVDENISINEKKKNNLTQDYSELDKWWKANDPTSKGYGFQGWPGVN
jgi:hypothetical protein